mmetsp:Transcript_18442/g.17563  ORF Transcript_18442/g.17563 Transcript_18442/m.17563 type:complete len:247 (+) Transcript_18442:666-1406(+)|eukprot:CAMPEP_0170553398 /NCGR_PEP_ID=MMETSP0211-20121228/11208_1 /TAXON_ID=311385 /ORGANISM="Pseudokeronopsis sp., Strain OXSARD2" /LENGTH=246 /DNA_ID=CAMNT_0010861687 /DNA_START=621 /DNA_END=1364 /DNA_ORIENTATION=+
MNTYNSIFYDQENKDDLKFMFQLSNLKSNSNEKVEELFSVQKKKRKKEKAKDSALSKRKKRSSGKDKDYDYKYKKIGPKAPAKKEEEKKEEKEASEEEEKYEEEKLPTPDVQSTISERPKRLAATNKNYKQDDSFQMMMNSEQNGLTYSLVTCSQYKSFSQQPYLVYISLEALLILNIHSHLSKNEVIGYLGGFCFDTKDNSQKYILIHQAYPCKSIVENQRERSKNVEICPESADLARQQIINNN